MKTAERRKFIQQLATGSLAAFALPVLGKHDPSIDLPKHTTTPDEQYWEMVKKQFAVTNDLIMMNAANLCPSPYVVNERVIGFTHALSKDVSFQYRSVFASLRTKSLKQLANFVGADAEEIGITRNTSESNSHIIQGLDFKTGDEIVIWDQNHPSNHAIWYSKAKRYGLAIRNVSVPKTPESTQALIDPFIKAITPKTKLIAFSQISNLSGIALPVKEICAIANSKGILTLVDGAQSLGFLELNLHEMGCSFFSASTHKWLMGPFENGILYVRKDLIHRLWPTIVGGGWKEAKSVDENLCVLGQRNETSTAAIPEIINFHHAIGRKNICDRVMYLTSYLKEQIKSTLPEATFVTPLDSLLSGGIVIINLPGKDPGEVTKSLYEKHGIATAPSGGIRLSPHIYNTKKDINTVVNALSSI
ncbi:MAG: aminotransferase class V-fold PLP-dependent enzyme [Cyclobacteriaceae bacterium]|nr:aminotransferase class V-fold PLP-dependent enzyme [Cyclobacteriaceae bacterium]